MPPISDSIAASERLSHYSDQVDVNERLTVTIGDASVIQTDTVGLTEAIAVGFDMQPFVETIAVSESVTHYSDQADVMDLSVVSVGASANATDSATASDTVGLVVPIGVLTAETALTSEALNLVVEITRLITVNDALSCVDAATVLLYTPLPDMNLTVTAGIQQTGGVRVV